jgi:PAS domain S-box-containing protein
VGKADSSTTASGERAEARALSDELRVSEERYRLLFEATPLPIFVFDCETFRYLAVNEAAVRKYGYTRDELLRMTVLDIRPPEDVARLKTILTKLEGNNLHTGVWRHRGRDGTVFEVEITTHALEFGGRRARLVVANDVTERRRLEEQLRQSQKMEAIGLLAGGVAHDFNNLLGVVLGATQLARRACVDGRPAEAFLEEIAAAAKRAAELTRKLLAFSRKQVLDTQPLDLREAVDDFLQLLRRVIGEDVEFVVRRSPEPLLVNADASQLEQVLLNLCTNARQAMPGGGKIVLETARTRFGAAAVAREPWAAEGDWAEVRIVDTGVGMTPDTHARIFEPFFTTKSEGTGLGLAMVHGIVHQHRGLLHVDSRLGEGTTVRVCLPLLADERPTDRATSQPTVRETRGGRETLLVAEDEPALRKLLGATLGELGYEVLVAADGEDATRILESRKDSIAVAILDVVMPRLGGVQAYERMRAVARKLKVIFTTGYAHEHAQVSAIVRRRGHAVLSKPFTLEELARKVRETLDSG